MYFCNTIICTYVVKKRKVIGVYFFFHKAQGDQVKICFEKNIKLR